MKLVSLLVGVSFVFSTSAWSKDAVEAPQLGAFVVTDVTSLYPRNNYYDQLQECSESGLATGPGVTPVLVGGDTGQSNNTPLLPGVGASPAAGNPNPGEIIIKTPGHSDNSTGGYVGGGYNSMPNYPGTGRVNLDQIVNVGYFIWQIIQSSKPNMRLSTYRAHGLPKGVSCWTELEEWKLPKSKVFTVEQKSIAGKAISKFTFRISFVYGGTYNGKGKYLANVTVSPVDLQVAWGTDFGSEVHIPSVFNMGTKENPLAAMQIFVYWNVGSAVKMQQKSQLFHITGNGDIQAAAQ